MPETRRFSTSQLLPSVEIDGKVYQAKPVSTEEAWGIWKSTGDDAFARNGAIAAATFGISFEEYKKLPYIITTELVKIALTEVNELVPENQSGEAKATES